MGIFTSVSTIIALVVGAGMLGLPFVIFRAGFWNGVFQVVFLGLMITILNLFVGEVVLRTKGRHHLVHLTRKYLGNNAGSLMFWAFVLGQYGALIAYIVGISSVLSIVFGSYGLLFSYLMILGMVLLLLFRLRVIARAESFLSIVMICVIFLLCLIISPESRLENFTLISDTPLFAYGVILFAFMGFTIIPEISQEVGDKKDLARVIMVAYGIIIFVYVLFSYSFVGVFGSEVAEVATESLTGGLLLVGAFMTLLLLVTSFLAIGVVMKDVFSLDLKFKNRVPWLLTIIPPLLAWLFLHPDFVEVISIVGSFTGGVVGVLVCLTLLKSRERGDRKPEFVSFGSDWLVYLIILILFGGMAWQLSVLL